jgi:hypothetical protein
MDATTPTSSSTEWVLHHAMTFHREAWERLDTLVTSYAAALRNHSQNLKATDDRIQSFQETMNYGSPDDLATLLKHATKLRSHADQASDLRLMKLAILRDIVTLQQAMMQDEHFMEKVAQHAKQQPEFAEEQRDAEVIKILHQHFQGLENSILGTSGTQGTRWQDRISGAERGSGMTRMI